MSNGLAKNLAVRTKRGKLIAEMGLVNRDERGFIIKSINRKEVFRVWRDEKGRVCCSCPDFITESTEDASFRCEHILAVKHYLEASSSNMGVTTAETVAAAIPAPPIKESIKEPVQPESAFASYDMEMEDEEEMMPEMPVVKAAVANSSAVQTISRPTADVREAKEVKSATELNFANVLNRLSRPIPKEYVRQRVGWTDRSGHEHEIDYIEWHTVADLLDQVHPEWSHAVKDIRQIGELIAVTASITILGVTREGVGTGSAYDEKGIKKAEHDALKRAAVKFGIARELYKRDDDDANETQTLKFPRNPVAKDISEMATTKQHAAIRAIANAQGIDAEAECEATFNCKLAEISRRAASAFIDHLKTKQSLSA